MAAVLAGVAVTLLVWRPFQTRGNGSAGSTDASTAASSKPLPPGLVRAIADLRAAGFATTAAEWNGVPLDSAENGAVEIDAAAATLDSEEKAAAWRTIESWLFTRWWEDARPEQLAELRAYLDATTGALDLVETGLRKPRIRWPMVELEHDVLPGSRSVRRIQDLCAAAARVEGGDALLRVLAIQLRLDRRVEDGWIRRAGVEEATAALRDAVIAGRVEAAAARRALDADLTPFVFARMSEAIRGWIVNSVSFLKRVYGEGVPRVTIPDDLPPELATC